MTSPGQNKNIYHQTVEEKSILTAVPQDIRKIIKSFNVEKRRPLRLSVNIAGGNTGIELDKCKDGYKITMVEEGSLIYRPYPYDENKLFTDGPGPYEEGDPLTLIIDTVDDLIDFIHIRLCFELTFDHGVTFTFENQLILNCEIDSKNFKRKAKRMINLIGKIYTPILPN